MKKKPAPKPPLRPLAERLEQWLNEPREVFARGPLYLRSVLWAKVAFPALAVALLAIVFIWPQLSQQEKRLKVDFPLLANTDQIGSYVTSPRYMGVNAKGQNFQITAKSAYSASGEGGSAINLDQVQARLQQDDKNSLVLAADQATFWHKQRKLALAGNVTFINAGGYRLTASQAYADLKAGVIWGDQPILGQGPLGSLKGQGFRILDQGNRLILQGKSTITLNPVVKSKTNRS